MARFLADKKVSTLILVTVLGLIIGSYSSLLIGMIPGESNVVKELFVYNFLDISTGYPEPLSVDIKAIGFQFGFLLKINVMSIIGAAIALWIYRGYR
ncbi:MAG: DUF4321 domain-containing protein [Chitinivibrionia bacterium]|nr:DUF4321 domain-containing protein [Chitinivibrionia bacterium]